jgi:Cryptococcal mannosyltransferase 1
MFTSRLRRHEGYELVHGRSSSESPNRVVTFPRDDEAVFSAEIPRRGLLSTCLSFFKIRRFARGSRWRRTVSRFLSVTISVLLILIIITPIFNPSYSRRPSHYLGSNPNQERVFIAANIVDKDLIRGAWGKAVLDLIDIIGQENAFLSIYENDSGPETKKALQELSEKVKCKRDLDKCLETRN